MKALDGLEMVNQAAWAKQSGILVQCDPSIKALIVKIDSEDHSFIVEELDDQTLVIQETMMPVLRKRLDAVSPAFVVHQFVLIRDDRNWSRLSSSMMIRGQIKMPAKTLVFSIYGS